MSRLVQAGASTSPTSRRGARRISSIGTSTSAVTGTGADLSPQVGALVSAARPGIGATDPATPRGPAERRAPDHLLGRFRTPWGWLVAAGLGATAVAAGLSAPAHHAQPPGQGATAAAGIRVR